MIWSNMRSIWGGGGDAGLEDEAAAAGGFDGAEGFSGAGFVGVVVDDDGGAVTGEGEGDAASDTFARAGDEGDLSGELNRHPLFVTKNRLPHPC